MTDEREFPNLRLFEHPLIQDRLGRMRDQSTPRPHFRRLLTELSLLAACEMTRDFRTVEKVRETPVDVATTEMASTSHVLLVPILRAGLGAVDAWLRVLPGACTGHVGVQRDPKTKEPIEYLVKLPPDPGGPVFVLDPMVATGQTAVHALKVLNRHGIDDSRIRFQAVVLAPEGLRLLRDRCPNVPVHAASLDRRLNQNKQIVPGIGDVGDRLFGT
jgi:uracil phosphoribosyltransferase